MPEIESLKRRLLEFCKAKNCPDGCKHPSPCTCDIIADVKAHMLRHIPRGYENCSIDDFTGAINGVDVISTDVARKAKEKLSEYIWNDPSIWLTKRKMSNFDLDSCSVLDDRLYHSTNVVIYGDGEKSGRTMLASILLKEAIRRRIALPLNINQHYGWLEFTNLVSMLRDRDYEKSKEYRSCDWLVIDNITDTQFETSSGARAYIQNIIDPFFYERWEEGLVTVLVFKVNIELSTYDIERYLGVGINRIVSHPDTFKISLCEEDRDGR